MYWDDLKINFFKIIKLILKVWKGGMSVSEGNMPLDFFISITVSDDKLSAHLLISNTEDTFKVSIGQLLDLVQKNRIIHGVNQVVLAEIAANPKSFSLKKDTNCDRNQTGRWSKWYIKLSFDFDDNEKKPLELEDGRVNYKEVVSIHNVRKGQLIGQRFLATAGTLVVQLLVKRFLQNQVKKLDSK